MASIELIPTYEEYQANMLKGMDILLSLHSKGECYDDCFFCSQEEILYEFPMKIEIDGMLESHNGSVGGRVEAHWRLIGYPFVSLCEYCRVENWIVRNKEYRLETNKIGRFIYERGF